MAKKRHILKIPNESNLPQNLAFISVSTKFLPAYKLANLLNRHLNFALKYLDEWKIDLSRREGDVVYHRVFHGDIENEFCAVFLLENFTESPLFRTSDYNSKKNLFLEYDFSMIIVEFEDGLEWGNAGEIEDNAKRDFLKKISLVIEEIDMWNACKSIDLQAFMRPQIILEHFFSTKQKILANSSTLPQTLQEEPYERG
ncbi:hypothetical protein FACS1894178_1400 [Bacteroidia bacterium]|nr:hypothetical protein FACS1894178_1400 [Bacteroidia bacterium]